MKVRREMAVGHCDVLAMKPARGGTSLRSIALAIVALLLVTKVATFLVAAQFATWAVLVGVSLGSGLLGLAVIGIAVWRYAAAVAAKLDRDECLDDDLASGLVLVLAGVLLLLPGILCDCLGLLLLLPWTRRFFVAKLRQHLAAAPVYSLPQARASRDSSGTAAEDGPAIVSFPPRRRAA